MRSCSVLVSSETFVDAFAYRGYVYAWTIENYVAVFEVSELVEQLQRAHGTTGLGVAYALFSSRGIGATTEMLGAFATLDMANLEVLEITAEPVARVRAADDDVHLTDMQVTYDRFYFATDAGLFIGPADPLALGESDSLATVLEREGQCFGVSTGLRAVAASFGAEGLFVVTNESDERLGPRREFLLRESSIRSTIGATRVTNFVSESEYHILPATTVYADVGDAAALQEVETEVTALEASNSTSRGTADGFLLWDSKSRRMLQLNASGIRSLGRLGGRQSPETRVRTVEQVDLSVDVVSAAMTGNRHFAIETDESVLVLRNGATDVFPTGPCLSLRAYRNSWRFQRLVTATSRSGLWLIAAVQDDEGSSD